MLLKQVSAQARLMAVGIERDIRVAEKRNPQGAQLPQS